MRDFSWKYFTMTGNVDAYLLFKESQPSEELDLEEEMLEDYEETELPLTH